MRRGAFLVPRSGTFSFELYGPDWSLAAGHRIGVLITPANDEWWEHHRSGATVRLARGSIALPFLRRTRTSNLAGGAAAKLTEYRQDAPFAVDAKTIADSESPMTLPPGRPLAE